jgi:cyclophilin family peptidyl-prolyl cis-trans isomerase/HEAT repeat protein
MSGKNFRKLLYTGILVVMLLTTGFAQNRSRSKTSIAIPTNTLLQIIRAEDQRRWDEKLKSLFSDRDPKVRTRAALAAGRIGDERAVLPLIDLLKKDTDWGVQQMAAFALGEIESAKATDALIEATRISDLRARALEALGKIAAALPQTEEPRRQAIGQVVLDALVIERNEAMPTAGGVRDLGVELFGLTAVLRARPAGTGKVVALYLSSPDPLVRAAALNTLARLRLKDGNDQVRHMLDHSNPIVRANAVRVLGATEDKGAFDALLDRALHDDDLRVRVSAIRSLGSLKDKRAVEPLLTRGNSLIHLERLVRSSRNELLEISTTLGRILPNTFNEGTVAFLEKMHSVTRGEAVEVEVAFARVVPGIFQNDRYKSEFKRPKATWRQVSRRAQGLAAIKDVITGAATNSAGDHALKDAQKELADMLRNSGTPTLALPDILQAYSSFKPADISELARSQLGVSDVILRSTAAEILGNQPPNEANTKALAEALPRALRDRDLNDAALAILDALAKQKNEEANAAIKTGLDSSDHLIRRRAVALLKANGMGDFSDRIGTVKTRNTESDYHRAIARIGRKSTATVVTGKGPFVIEFLPGDAPLTVDNFIQLARKGYFNGQMIPRVVANFVIQAGDPRGDTNGGPGYQIRCEIDEVLYERGAVGMALSGKDTGGSQWFVTHSPQPHLDGGYTVFGHVISGMEVVDNIARGDIILRVTVNER